jgi:hypothetical protein
MLQFQQSNGDKQTAAQNGWYSQMPVKASFAFSVFIGCLFTKALFKKQGFAGLIIMIITKYADAGFHCHKIYVKIRRLLL